MQGPIRLAVALLSSMACAFGSEFSIPGIGVVLETPASWRHDGADEFGYVIFDAARPEKRTKLRIHLAPAGAKFPAEQAERSLGSINERRKGRPAEIVRFSEAVRTKSGIEGHLSAHGFSGASDTPYIDHYYFPTRAGRIFCVCAYSDGDREAAAQMRKIILGSLRYADEAVATVERPPAG